MSEKRQNFLTLIRTIFQQIFDNKLDIKNIANTGLKNSEQSFENQVKKILIDNNFQEIEKEDLRKQFSKVLTKQQKTKKPIHFGHVDFDNDLTGNYFIKNPFGTQAPPDFILLHHNCNPVYLECKSGVKPVWNCSLPNDHTVYLYNSSNKNNKSTTYIFLSRHVITPENKQLMEEIHQQVKNLVAEKLKNSNNSDNFTYYPRPMYNQIKMLDEKDREAMYNDVLFKLEQ